MRTGSDENRFNAITMKVIFMEIPLAVFRLKSLMLSVFGFKERNTVDRRQLKRRDDNGVGEGVIKTKGAVNFYSGPRSVNIESGISRAAGNVNFTEILMDTLYYYSINLLLSREIFYNGTENIAAIENDVKTTRIK